jgi:hypothetical protein
MILSEDKMRKSIQWCMLVLATTAGFSTSASEQTPGCADVVWSEALLESTPNIASHCLEVVRRGDEWYVRIQAKIVRHGASSSVVRYRESDGSWSNAERAYPPRGFKAEIAGQEVPISQTAVGQEFHVYATSQGGENFTIPMLEAEAMEEAMEEAIEDAVEEKVEVEVTEDENN